MNPPPTPALDLVIDALREFGIKCASELNVTGTVLRFADEKAEPAARALLQKLSDHGAATFHCVCTLDAEGNLEPCKTHAQWAKSIAPPDAVRAEPVAWLCFNDYYHMAKVGDQSIGSFTLSKDKDHPMAVYDASPAQGWRPISEAPKGYDVLMVRKDYGIVIADWGDYASHNQPRFTHWQPLPAPPPPAGESK